MFGEGRWVTWNVEDCEDAKLAADLANRTCLRWRIGMRLKHPLIYADILNSM